MTEELESLVVSGKDIDRKLVTEILTPYLRLDKDACNIRPLETWDQLKAWQKILLYLLARKAMAALGFNIAEEAATPTEVATDTGLKQGTVNPALRALTTDDRLTQWNEGGRYFIPNHAIERVKAMLIK